MRALSTLALAFLAGCASPQGASAPASAPVQTTIGGTAAGTGVTLTRENEFISTELAWDAARVWPVVPQAYADLGLPVSGMDQATRVATTNSQRVRRVMGKGPAAYFHCAGPYGNAASRDDVYMTVRTQVLPGQGSRTILRITASAVARSTTSANTTTDCASNGALEKLLAETITARVAG